MKHHLVDYASLWTASRIRVHEWEDWVHRKVWQIRAVTWASGERYAVLKVGQVLYYSSIRALKHLSTCSFWGLGLCPGFSALRPSIQPSALQALWCGICKPHHWCWLVTCPGCWIVEPFYSLRIRTSAQVHKCSSAQLGKHESYNVLADPIVRQHDSSGDKDFVAPISA